MTPYVDYATEYLCTEHPGGRIAIPHEDADHDPNGKVRCPYPFCGKPLRTRPINGTSRYKETHITRIEVD